MKKFALPEDKNPSDISARSALEAVLRDGARKMLQEAIENEVLEYIQQTAELRNEMNKRLVTRNGRLPSRNIQTGTGLIPVQQPRVRDRREDHSFSSAILPKYKRRTKSLDPRTLSSRDLDESFSRCTHCCSWRKCGWSISSEHRASEREPGARI